jgi:general stress protein CsbA
MTRTTFGVLYAGWVATVLVGILVNAYWFKHETSAYFVMFQFLIGAVFAYILQDKPQLEWINRRYDALGYKNAVSNPDPNYAAAPASAPAGVPTAPTTTRFAQGRQVASAMRAGLQDVSNQYREKQRMNEAARLRHIQNAANIFGRGRPT